MRGARLLKTIGSIAAGPGWLGLVLFACLARGQGASAPPKKGRPIKEEASKALVLPALETLTAPSDAGCENPGVTDAEPPLLHGGTELGQPFAPPSTPRAEPRSVVAGVVPASTTKPVRAQAPQPSRFEPDVGSTLLVPAAHVEQQSAPSAEVVQPIRPSLGSPFADPEASPISSVPGLMPDRQAAQPSPPVPIGLASPLTQEPPVEPPPPVPIGVVQPATTVVPPSTHIVRPLRQGQQRVVSPIHRDPSPAALTAPTTGELQLTAGQAKPLPKPEPPAKDEDEADLGSSLDPPDPERLFQRDSEESFRERLRQHARQRLPTRRIEFPSDHVALSAQPLIFVERPAQALYVEPNYLCRRRLLFQQTNFERYGWELGVLQPALSAGLFYWDVFTLPVHLAMPPWTRFESDAGRCQPGDPVPLRWNPLARP